MCPTYPSMGKHIAFDCKLLHCAIETFLSKSVFSNNSINVKERGINTEKLVRMENPKSVIIS